MSASPRSTRAGTGFGPYVLCNRWAIHDAPAERQTEPMLFSTSKTTMISPDKALTGRDREVLANPTFHEIFGIPVQTVPAGSEVAYFALGCFWGAEKLFWRTPGVTNTAVGYAGGFTRNPTYEEVCSARTGHTEAVLVAFDPEKTSYEEMLRLFWEGHDPTQGMRQGNDVGTQYRSAIYWFDESQREAAEASARAYAERLGEAGYGDVTTEIAQAGDFYYAE